MAIGSEGLPLGRVGGVALKFCSVVCCDLFLDPKRIYLYHNGEVAHCRLFVSAGLGWATGDVKTTQAPEMACRRLVWP